jgi:hypothetical protein
LFLLPNSEVQGPIEVTVSESARISGFFDGLGLQVGGNLTLSGPLGNNVKLAFTGFNQRLFAASDFTVNELTLDQTVGVGEVPTLTIVSDEPTIELTIGNQLVLENGIIVSGPHRIILPGSTGGFIRNTSPANGSHVFGQIGRLASGGSSGSYIFPLGGKDLYRPVSLLFGDALLTSTNLTVQHVDNAPVGVEGLPVEFQDGLVVKGLTSYSWNIFSSVNFAQSQSVTITAAVEQTGQSPTGHRLTARTANDFSDAWAPASNVNQLQVEPGTLTLDAIDTRGLLTPNGTQISVGTPNPLQYTGEIQFVQGTASDESPQLIFEMDDAIVFHSSEVAEASPATAVGFTDATAQKTVDVRDVDSNQIIASTIVQMQSGQNAIVALLENASGAPVLTSANRTSTPPAPGTFAVASINGSATIDPGMFSFDGENSALPSIAPGEISSVVDIDAQIQLVELFSGADQALTEQYRFDFGAVSGQDIHLLISGSPENGTLQSSVVLRDGSVLAMSIVTGTEDYSEELPDDLLFNVYQNFPNPFRTTTSIPFDLPESSDVQLQIVDLLGRIVLENNVGQNPAGQGHLLTIDGSRLPAGIYLYRMIVSSGSSKKIATGKMIRLR